MTDLPSVGALTFERLEADADLDAIAAIAARCFTHPWTREMFARELAQPDIAHLFVLRLPDGAIAAFCSCWLTLDELHVNTMAVDLPYRRRGLGTRLMRLVMAHAARANATRATLEVRASNAPAIRLYESLGFRATGIRRNYYTHPVEDALILWRENLEDLGSMPDPEV